MYAREVRLETVQVATLDAIATFSAGMLAVWLRHGTGLIEAAGPTPWLPYALPAAGIALVVVLLLRMHGVYTEPLGRLTETLRIARALAIGTTVALAATFFYRGYSYSRVSVALFFPLAVGIVLGSRALYRQYGRALRASPVAARRALILGCGTAGRHLANALTSRPGYYHLVGFLDDDSAKRDARPSGAPVLGTTGALAEIVTRHEIDEVLIAVPSAPTERITDWIGECMRLGVQWKFVPHLCDLVLERMRLDTVDGLPLVALRGSSVVGYNWALKRAFDVAVAAIAMAITLPVWIFAAVAIRATSKGPILFRQERAGLGGKRFTLLKFRSMRIDGDDRGHRDYATRWIYGKTGGSQGNVHKIEQDPRTTAVGRLLRRTSLDELPQFLNVLRGDMSIVGPRPPLPYEVERYTEWHKRRLDVLPGITGLWQVSGRNALSFEEMVRLDLDYIENWSLERDVEIVLRTVPALVFQRAY